TGDVVNDGTLAFQRVFSGNFNGDISGTGSVIQVGANTTITLGGSNSYTGGTTVNSGTLSSAVAGAFPHHTPFTVNGGTLSLQNSILLSMSALQGDGGQVDLKGTKVIVEQSSDTSFAGAIIGSGELTKSGGGTLTLAGINTYEGPTTVESGTLQADGTI